MSGLWDSIFKRLVGTNRRQFVKWLLPRAKYVREVSAHLNRDIDIDILFEILIDGERALLHIEFQRYNDARRAKRVLEYNVFASCKFDCPVISFVIYLKKESKVVEPPLVLKLKNGQEILRLNFTNIKLWEIPTEELRRTSSVGLLPLLSLTREGGTHEVLEEAITSIQRSRAKEEMKANLLSMTLTLGTLAFDDAEDRNWLIRRFQMLQDILRDTEIYQMIMKEGVEIGHKKGHAEGVQEEQQRELENQRIALLRVVQARFPKLARLATKQASNLTDLETLRELVINISISQTPEEARQYLTEVSNNGNS